jgi:predicted CxxxxCH...CXXCH cytochrome family protein
MDTQDPAALLVAFDAANAVGAWVSDSGPQTGGCSNLACHATETPDWYGLAGVIRPPCAICHSDPIGRRRAVMGANGDFGANASILSRHVTNGPGSDPLADQCLVCHDMSLHMGGTVRLNNADTGAAIVYTAATPSSLEPFCLSCHDADGAAATFRTGGTPTAPFIDGSVMGQAPNRASAEITANWNKAFGHRQQGLTCIGNGTPNTGCHANGHGSLHVGLLARNLTLPNSKNTWFAVTDEPDYDLCFTCHANYARVTKEAILGFKQDGKYDIDFAVNGVTPPYFIPSIQTHFRDVNLFLTPFATGKPYDDRVSAGGQHSNLHLFHIQWFTFFIGPEWRYRDSIPSSIVCISCHNIHGSDTQWGWVYDTLQFSNTTVGTDQYGMIGAPVDVLTSYPTSCGTFNCHTNLDGPTHSWFEPSDE